MSDPSPVIKKNVSLKDYNSFGFDVSAAYFTEVDSISQVKEALSFAKQQNLSVYLLGGGSNLVLTKDINALVIRITKSDIFFLDECDGRVIIDVYAGLNWHKLVETCLERGWHGLENLALIPGSVGAAPVQNIGAYGVEVAELLIDIEVVDLHTGVVKRLAANQCQFGYRSSVFKENSGRYLIWSVRFGLHNEFCPKLSYGGLSSLLQQELPLTAAELVEHVCRLRREKLPEPAVLGNAGSFFENPVVDSAKIDMLRARFPDLVCYAQKDGRYKVAAGWLIEQAGWKGRRYLQVGCYEKQALVLVHFGGGDASQIVELSNRIKRAVFERFSIHLEQEPRCWPAEQ